MALRVVNVREAGEGDTEDLLSCSHDVLQGLPAANSDAVGDEPVCTTEPCETHVPKSALGSPEPDGSDQH